MEHIRKIANEVVTSNGLNKIGNCDICAKQIQLRFIQEGIPGDRIRFDTNIRSGQGSFIWDNGSQQQISTNGCHEAIVVTINNEKIVYDNVYHEGKPYKDWISDLEFTAQPNISVESF